MYKQYCINKDDGLLTHRLKNYMVGNSYFLKLAIVFLIAAIPSSPSKSEASPKLICSDFIDLCAGG